MRVISYRCLYGMREIREEKRAYILQVVSSDARESENTNTKHKMARKKLAKSRSLLDMFHVVLPVVVVTS